MPADSDRERRIAEAESALSDAQRVELARYLCALLYDAWQRAVAEADDPSPHAPEYLRAQAQRVREWRGRNPPPPPPPDPTPTPTDDDLRKRPRYNSRRRRPAG